MNESEITAKEAQQRANSRRVLVVDDDTASRTILRHVLSLRDFQTDEARDGLEASEMVSKGDYRLVIVDLRLPRLSGLALIERVRQMRPDLPIIIVSGGGGLDEAIEAIRHDVFFYFKKPIVNLDEFFHVIESAMERERLLRENRAYQEELHNLNLQLQEKVAEQTREISEMRDRLAELFQVSPSILAARDFHEKLDIAANALVSSRFFHRALIVLESFSNPPSQEAYTAAGGEEAIPESELETQYQRMKELLREEYRRGGSYIVFSEAAGEEHKVSDSAFVLVPLRGQDGRIIGIARLGDFVGASQPGEEVLHLLELFMAQLALSIEEVSLERELERSEAQYRTLVDNVSDLIFRLDLQGNFTFVSRRSFENLGYAWNELVGKSFLDLVPESKRELAYGALERLKESSGTIQDFTVWHKDGRELVLAVTANHLVELGQPMGILAIARDVTEKRRLEIQVRESEERYRALTENANDAIFILDPETYRFLEVNRRATELTGYSRDELLDMTAMDLRRPEHATQAIERIETTKMAGAGRFEDAPLRRKDGREIIVDIAATVLEIGGRRIYQSIVRDITQQKRTEETLRQRVMELQIFSEISDALQSSVDSKSVLGIILAGVTAGQALGFNRAFIFLYDEEEGILRGEAGVGPTSADEAGRIWSELSAKGFSLADLIQSYRTESLVRQQQMTDYARRLSMRVTADAGIFHRSVTQGEAAIVENAAQSPLVPREFRQLYPVNSFAVVPMISRDTTLGVLLVDNFITNRPITNEDLRRLRVFANSAALAIERSRLLASLELRLRQLTEANRELKESRDKLVQTERLSAIGEVAASVAHEIRNPLAAIGGFARSVLNSLVLEDPNRTRLHIIVDEVRRLEGILTEILQFTRPTMPRFEEADLNGIILQTFGMMSDEINKDLIKVQQDLNPNLPAIWADPDQIRQVLLNIFRNAIHAMPKGGTLCVQTRAQDDMVQVQVRDTGVGILKADLDKLFNAFFTTKSTGSGLGLTVSLQIVRNHGGTIAVESKEEVGSVFTISLPIHKRTA
ncbi:MAG: PAS domain S-box protein [Calditrichaeota bacterium]|nr:PAS domain S-box protein [Calditrichota bacterium]